MKEKLSAYIFALLLAGCVSHHNPSEFDLVALESDLESLSDYDSGPIPKEKWPVALNELNPESVLKNENGIYIKLDSAWVEESGLFYPAIDAGFSKGADPSYKLLGSKIYSYHIKG